MPDDNHVKVVWHGVACILLLQPIFLYANL